jgi:hypothetical protein
MKTKTTKSDFYFLFVGHGMYKATYTSPKTSKKYAQIITDMEIIDLTKNEDSPKLKDLNTLKRICKVSNI